MTEEKQEQIEIDEDIQQIVNSLNPIIDKDENGNPKITYNGETLSQAIRNIKNKTNEVINLENDKLGIRCSISSHKKDLKEIQSTAHQSLSWMANNTKLKKPTYLG